MAIETTDPTAIGKSEASTLSSEISRNVVATIRPQMNIQLTQFDGLHTGQWKLTETWFTVVVCLSGCLSLLLGHFMMKFANVLSYTISRRCCRTTFSPQDILCHLDISNIVVWSDSAQTLPVLPILFIRNVFLIAAFYKYVGKKLCYVQVIRFYHRSIRSTNEVFIRLVLLLGDGQQTWLT